MIFLDYMSAYLNHLSDSVEGQGILKNVLLLLHE